MGCVLTWLFLCACMEREAEAETETERQVSLPPLIRTTPVLWDQDPTLTHSFNLNYLLKGPNTIILEVKASTYGFWRKQFSP